MASSFYSKIHRVVIIGSGPSAHTAAIYTARADLSPILFEGFMAGGIAAGGQLTTTTDVENFPGFPTSIGGLELMDKMREQSVRSGTVIVTETIDRVDFSAKPFKLWAENATEPILTKSVIIATGATARKLPLKEGGEEYWTKGISACAVCDGPLPIYRNKDLAVLGGGDTACEEATFLTKFASKVFLLMRRDKFRASAAMVKRVLSNPKIEVLYGMVPESAHGNGKCLSHLRIVPTECAPAGAAARELAVAGFFFAIGHTPNVSPFVKSGIKMHDDNYIITEAGTTKTNISGVFACGDVADRKYRQAVTAAGFGCMAALECNHWLEDNE